MVVLLRQYGQLPGLLFLQPLKHGFMLRLGRCLQQMVSESLVLLGLSLTRLLELLFNLKLLGLMKYEEIFIKQCL